MFPQTKPILTAWEMAQPEKCLPNKCKELSSAPSTQVKEKPDVAQEAEITESLRLASQPSQLVSSKFNEKPCLKIKQLSFKLHFFRYLATATRNTLNQESW